MHHVVLERWSRGISPIHDRDARVKLAATLVFLVLVATTASVQKLAYAGYFAGLIAAILIAGLPLLPLLGRSALVLPFSLVFALLSWLGGDPVRAVTLVARSYISATAVLLLVSSTPLPRLLRALEWFRVPGLLILITQFLYRYLFVLSEQAQHMRLAASCRSGKSRSRVVQRSRFQAAAGALSVLFARSYLRADGVHRAMLSRGFSGRFPVIEPPPARLADAMFLLIAVTVPIAVRVAG